MFRRSALIYHDQVFVGEGPNRLTFQETESKVALMAGLLKKAGVGRGDHVGLVMENSILFVIAFWAVQRLGAAAVVFNTRLAAPTLEETRLPPAVETWGMIEEKFPKIRLGDDPA